MESLSASRLRKVLKATAQAAEFRDLQEFRAGAIALIRELVPCESASYNEVRPGTGAIGESNAELGRSLGISRRTVEKHLRNIYTWLDVTSRTQAIDRVRTSRER